MKPDPRRLSSNKLVRTLIETVEKLVVDSSVLTAAARLGKQAEWVEKLQSSTAERHEYCLELKKEILRRLKKRREAK